MNVKNKKVSKSDLITFHQINLQHSKLATLELIKQLEGMPRVIVLAQEPYFYNKLMFIPRQIKTISSVFWSDRKYSHTFEKTC